MSKMVKTIAKHVCATCNREIPKGSAAELLEKGVYLCWVCSSKQVYEPGESITGEEFRNWVRDNVEMLCPICGGRDAETGITYPCHPDIEWDKTEHWLVFTCDICGVEWERLVGFGPSKVGL